MEFELGLKITRATDDLTSAEFHIMKERAGPVFVSSETEAMFILTVHLKGFKKEDVKININEDGTRITISGERLVQETLMRGRIVYKKETTKRVFRRSFKVPNSVVLDNIKAKFVEEESRLKIYMPKLEKGISGDVIEEIQDEEEGEQGNTVSDDDNQKEHKKDEQSSEHREEERGSMMVDEMVGKKERELPQVEGREEIRQPAQKKGDEDTQRKKSHEIKPPSPSSDKTNGTQEPKTGTTNHGTETTETTAPPQAEAADKRLNLFGPCFLMGSALIASIVVFITGRIRAKKQ